MTLAVMLALLLGPPMLLGGLGRWRPGLALDLRLRMRIGMSSMLVFTGVGHFLKTQEMIAMLPEALPRRREIVLATGILELAAAIGLHLPGLRRRAAIGLALFFLAAFPANAYSALAATGLGGRGALYLLVRAPAQILFVFWAVACAGPPRRRREVPATTDRDPESDPDP